MTLIAQKVTLIAQWVMPVAIESDANSSDDVRSSTGDGKTKKMMFLVFAARIVKFQNKRSGSLLRSNVAYI
jgi:hypothetical protein